MYGGTGLALAICSRLADLMAGELELESAPGLGSTFSVTVTLPITSIAAEQLPDPPVILNLARMQSAIHKSANLNSRIVLVVDDHPVSRKLMAIQLGIIGLRVEIAENGEVAFSKWREGKFDAIITDCQMPKMDGYALTQAIRAIETQEQRPRIQSSLARRTRKMANRSAATRLA